MRISDWSSDVCSSDLLTCAESGGDRAVVAPDRTSFRTLLMERSVQNNLGGTIEPRWEPGGLIVDITVPARWRDASAHASPWILCSLYSPLLAIENSLPHCSRKASPAHPTRRILT